MSGCFDDACGPAPCSREERKKQYERRQKFWEAAARKREFTSTPAADRNVKRKHCALDFDTLDCPICLEPLFPPVYQCQNGHTACAGCCKMLVDKGSCPSCALPIGANRCIVVEKIIESLEVNCKYAVWGCKEMLQYSKITRDEHECLCKFRPYHCPVVGCNHEGPKSGLPQHFHLVHNGAELEQLQPEDERKFSFTVLTKYSAYDKSHSQYALLQVFEYQDEDEDDDDYEDGNLFLIHHQFHEKLCRYSFSCTSFGACKSLIRYRLSVNFERTRGFKDNHSITGPILDNQKDNALLSKVVGQGDCLLVPKLYPAQKDGPQFEVKLSLFDEEEDDDDDDEELSDG